MHFWYNEHLYGPSTKSHLDNAFSQTQFTDGVRNFEGGSSNLILLSNNWGRMLVWGPGKVGKVRNRKKNSHILLFQSLHPTSQVPHLPVSISNTCSLTDSKDTQLQLKNLNIKVN